jgi:VanZ family protein
MKRQQHLLILIFLMFTVIISWLLSTDLNALAFRGVQIDTIGHFFGFFMLTWFIHQTLKLSLLELVMALSGYAALTEIAQFYLGFRNGEISDFMADILGISFYALVKWAFIVYGKPKSP